MENTITNPRAGAQILDALCAVPGLNLSIKEIANFSFHFVIAIGGPWGAGIEP
jgi:hypothetical protein